MSDYQVIGKQIRDVFATERVTGEALFPNDMRYPGMLYAKPLRAVHARANILNMDVSEAEKLPGVHLVMTHKDYPRFFFNEVLFVGQEIACVVADDLRIAEKALRLIKVEYEVLTPVLDPYEAKKPGSPLTMPEHIADMAKGIPVAAMIPTPGTNLWPYNAYQKYSDPDEKGLMRKREKNVTDYDGFGDIDEAEKEADLIVEDGGYIYPRAQAPLMGLGGCVANYHNGQLTLHIPNQFPAYAQMALSMALRIPQKDVNIVTRVTGGAFGANLSSGLGYSYADAIFSLMACAASIKLERPVSLFYTREEEFYYYWGRSGMDGKAKVGFKKDGTLVSTETEIWRNVSTGGWIGSGTLKYDATCTGMMLYSHNCKAVRHRKYNVMTNTPAFVGWQGFGNPEVFFAMESVMDQAAEKLGMDPVELRKKNHMRGGDNFMDLTYEYTDVHWLGHTGVEPSIDAALKQVPWKERKPASEKTGILRHGIGMSLHAQQNGGEGLAGSAAVKLYNDGSAVLISNFQDIGQGGRGAQVQIVAETLSLPYEKVRIVADETVYTPSAHPQTCSSGTFIMGNAACMAAKEAKRKLLEMAALMAKCPPEALDTKNGMIFPKGMPDKAFPWIAAFAQLNQTTGATESISGFARFKVPAGPMPAEQGATFVELDVDTETGELKNVKATISQDCGTALNPRVVAAHYMSVHHCLEVLTGGAEMVLDKKTGKMLNNSFIDYSVATMLDSEIAPIVVENPDPATCYGNVGIGQGFNNGVAAAVSNAIYNAIGVRMKEAPFTPARVLKALGKL